MTKATYWTYSLDLSNLFAEIFNGFKRIDIIMFVSKCFRMILANVYVCNYRGRLDVGHDQFIYYLHLKLRLKGKNDWLVYFRFNSTVTFKQEQWWYCKKLHYLITSKVHQCRFENFPTSSCSYDIFEILRSRMRNFQGIIFIWIWIYGEIFKSVLV